MGVQNIPFCIVRRLKTAGAGLGIQYIESKNKRKGVVRRNLDLAMFEINRFANS